PRPPAGGPGVPPGGEGVWGWISRRVVHRPVAVWAGAVVLLVPLAVLGLGGRPTHRPPGEVSQGCGSLRGLGVIGRHFTPGEVGPVTVLLESSADWNAPRGQALLDHLSRGFCLLDNVAEVRGLTRPLGAAPAPPGPVEHRGPESLLGAVWRNVM